MPDWWRRAVVYQVYIRSFADANGDGIGDIAGIRSRLGYLRDLGVDALWVNPWYPSPMVDGGYDVADYRAIDPRFGTLDDARRLIEEAHDHGLRVLGDIVPNHTRPSTAGSGRRSRARRARRPVTATSSATGAAHGGEEPPNNWPSVFGGPAWTRVASPGGGPGQWYLHLFDPGQPDLNWENDEVAGGVRVDPPLLVRPRPRRLPDRRRPRARQGRRPCPTWRREPTRGRRPTTTRSGGRTARTTSTGRGGGSRDAYGGDRVFIGEIGPMGPDGPARLARYLRPDELHQAFNFDFLAHALGRGRAAVRHRRRRWRRLAEVGAPATWVLSNHDVDAPRHALRPARTPGLETWEPWVERQPTDRALGARRARAAPCCCWRSRAPRYVYQGEELGLWEVEDLPDELLQDPTWERSGHEYRGRDGCRRAAPVVAGRRRRSGSGRPARAPWLPQPAEWASLSVEAQARRRRVDARALPRGARALRRDHAGLAGEALRWLPSPEGNAPPRAGGRVSDAR